MQTSQQRKWLARDKTNCLTNKGGLLILFRSATLVFLLFGGDGFGGFADMLSGFKVAVLGTINRDTVFTSQGERWEGFGGILYNLFGLSFQGRGGITLYPICNLGEDCYEEVMGILSQVDNIRCDGIRKRRGINNHAIISYRPSGEREEALEGGLPPLKYSEVESYLGVDLLLVNFISGFDLDLDTLRRMRRKFKGIIYMDLHSLTLGVDPQGRRFLRPIPQGEEWIAQADILQVNQKEAELLWGGPLKGAEEFSRFGRKMLSLGPFCLLVTLGSRGSFLLEKGSTSHFPTSSAALFDDPTGCGDIFAAGFIWEYLRSGDTHEACQSGNRLAARGKLISQVRSRMRRPDSGLKNLKDGGVF